MESKQEGKLDVSTIVSNNPDPNNISKQLTQPSKNSSNINNKYNITYLRSESPFHRVATLYCSGCLYLEFPGCLIHNGLLCHQKGNGYMSCLGCETERKQAGTESDTI